MAYDKIIVIRSRLDRCLCYAQNEEKTDLTDALRYIENPAKARLQTAINCGLETAFQEMQATKRRWGKCGGILGYQTATAALCSLSAGSYSGRTGHTDKFGSLLCHRLYRQEYHSPSDPEAASAEKLPPCNRQHFRQTEKKPQAAGLFRRWHGFSCSDLRVFCRCCLMSDFFSLSYSATCLHGCFNRC